MELQNCADDRKLFFCQISCFSTLLGCPWESCRAGARRTGCLIKNDKKLVFIFHFLDVVGERGTTHAAIEEEEGGNWCGLDSTRQVREKEGGNSGKKAIRRFISGCGIRRCQVLFFEVSLLFPNTF